MKRRITRSCLPPWRLVLLLLAITCCGPAHGVETQFTAKYWKVNNGLPGYQVFSICQARDGYFWLATSGGVARFDGVEFEKIPTSLGGAGSAVIKLLRLDHTGRLLAAFEDGSMGIFGGGQFHALTNPLPELMLFTNTTAMEVRKSVEVEVAALEPNPQSPVRFDYHLWTLGQGGEEFAVDAHRRLVQREDGRWRVKAPSTISGETKVQLLSSSTGGGVWTFDGTNLFLFRGGRWVNQLPVGEQLQGEELTAMLEDSSQALWLGTSSGRLIRFKNGGIQNIPLSETRTAPGRVNDLLEDNMGNLWVATQHGGLARLRPAAFRTYGVAEGLPVHQISALAHDPNGQLLLGTLRGGLHVLERNRVYGPNALVGATKSITALLSSRQGGTWIASYGEGLIKLHGPNSRRWRTQDGLANANLLSLCESSTGLLWLGTSAGVFTFDGKAFSSPHGVELVANKSIRALSEDTEGNIWLGTDAGLFCYTSGAITHPPQGDPLATNHITSLSRGNSGVLWIGTADAGITGYKQGKFFRLSGNGNLPYQAITTLVEDAAHHLWVGSDQGMFRLFPPAGDQLADRKGDVRSFHYNVDDGLASTESLPGSPSAIATPDGQVWFATSGGLSVAAPPPPGASPETPSVLISSVRWNGVAIYSNLSRDPAVTESPPQPFEMPPGNSHLEISYTALNLSLPIRTHFKIKMEGVDQDWRNVGPRRVAYYDGLAPGRYRFLVKALPNGGEWSQSEGRFEINIQPHLWQRWWFWGAVLTAMGTVAWWNIRARIKNRERILEQQLEQTRIINAERSRIAHDMHDEMGSCLTRISLLSDAAEHEITTVQNDDDGMAKTLARISRISDLSRSLVRSMEEIVWATNPVNDSLEEFATYLSHYAQDLLPMKGIACRLSLPERLPSHAFPSAARHQLFLVIKEALNNIIKHSGATCVTISLAAQRELLLLEIHDNGKGFDLENIQRKGNGLPGMKKRIQEIGGNFELSSSRHDGTRLRIQVRLMKAAQMIDIAGNQVGK